MTTSTPSAPAPFPVPDYTGGSLPIAPASPSAPTLTGPAELSFRGTWPA